MRRTIDRVLLAGAGLAAFACNTWFLNGAYQHKPGTPIDASAELRAPECIVIASGAKVPGAETTYHLQLSGSSPKLFEIYPDGRGSVLENYWKDDEGHHFAAFVSGGQGYHYVIDESLRSGTRFVYDSFSKKTAVRASFRLAGEPAARCAMVPAADVPEPDASKPADDDAEPAPSPKPLDPPPAEESPLTDAGAPAPDATDAGAAGAPGTEAPSP